MDTIVSEVIRTQNINEIRDGLNCKNLNCNDTNVFNMHHREQSDTAEQLLNVNVYCTTSYDVCNSFSGHTSSTGRSNCDQRTSFSAEQFSVQRESMGAVLGPRANSHGDGTYDILTNTTNNTYQNLEYKHIKTGHYGIQSESRMVDSYCSKNNVTADYFMVDFTNWQYFQESTGDFFILITLKDLIIRTIMVNFIIFKWVFSVVSPFLIVIMFLKAC